MDYKEKTKASYEATAKKYAENVVGLAPSESIEKLTEFLPPPSTLLDIGCDSGRDAKIFSEKGTKLLELIFVNIC